MGKALLLVLLTLLASSQGLSASAKVSDDPELLVRLDGNGYRDVVVALRDDLDERDCQVLVNGIQVRASRRGKSNQHSLFVLHGDPLPIINATLYSAICALIITIWSLDVCKYEE